ncbi:SRPBCC domain-containing protein [Kitasatospora sp. A2-31]|uniref:SRPBCC family protein n=1 Tax=Kitasatospora sp. A2-31 TaxID=2916414 RepID=UPI001EEA4BAF|nr:SRPBCC domain-containing protein [Kitasatospora sp. A2-31]MCG6497130.1 SRPBCC domain-containing protein [Kitasatospora sp. A2-31]
MTENLGELTITRELPGSAAAAFRAYLDPEQFVRFWGPAGVHVPLETVTIEPRVGGRYDSTMVVDATGERYPMKAEIVELREGELLAVVEASAGMRSTLTFRDLDDDRTEVVLHQTDVPDRYNGPDAVAGLNSSFDRLVEHLAGRG